MNYDNTLNLILKEINEATHQIDRENIDKFIEDILNADKVFVTGVGRVMLSLQAFVKRLNHLGITAYCVGDIAEPAITEKDILIVGSGSGCSIIPVVIAKKAKEYNAKIIHIGSNPHSNMETLANYMVRIPVRTRLFLEDETESGQPMTSLFEQSLLVFCDTIAMMIIEKKGLNMDKLWMYHANLE